LRALPHAAFVLDGELVIPIDGEVSFDALQMRLHPAQSRIDRLAGETPATLILFDCLLLKPLLDKPFAQRRQALEGFFQGIGDPHGLVLTPVTRQLRKAKQWLNNRQASLDGIVAKRLDLPYRPGERAMLKIKRRRAADCVVGGFRYESNRRQVGSLLLGLYDRAGLLHHVGFTSALAGQEKPALTRRLEKLVAPPLISTSRPARKARQRNPSHLGSNCQP